MTAANNRYLAQGLSLSEALVKAESDTRRAFAHKFENPKKTQGDPVSPVRNEQRPKRYGMSDLNPEQKQVWAVLKKSMTFEDYIDGLKAQGELK